MQTVDSLKLDETVPIPSEKSFLVCNAELTGFMPDHLDFVSFFARLTANQMRITSSKIIHLPTETIKWHTVKGPFVHAKTKEVFERQTHKRLLQLFDAHPDTVKEWISYVNENLPNGVDLKVERFEWNSLDFTSKELKENIKEELLKKKDRSQLIVEAADQYIKLFSKSASSK